MRETLYLLLPADEQAPVSWRIDGALPGLLQRGTLDEALACAAGRRLLAFAPAELVRLCTVDLPIRSTARLRAAVPYALEDQLAEDIESLHFALGPRGPEGVPVAIVARAQMRDWMSRFAAHGVRPERLLPEVLCLPWEPGCWTVLATAQRVLVRTGAADGFSCPLELLPGYLSLAPVPDEVRVRVHQVDGAPAELPGLPRVDELVSGYADELELLIDTARSQRPLDLLQGEYSARAGIGRRLRAWRLPAAMAALWLLVAGMSVLADAQALRREAAGLAEHNRQRWLQLFPQETRIADLRRQLDQKLAAAAGGSSDSGFLELLAVVAQVLPGIDGLQLQSLQYQNRELYLSMQGTQLQALEALRRAFAQRGDAELEVQSADAGSQGVQIRARVRRR